MTWKKPNTNYWDNKFASYMHDPVDKALDIKGHVKRASELMQLYGLAMPNNEFWKKADGIASGFERGQITGYISDENKSGSVDFLKSPIITHPIGNKFHLKIDMNNIDPKAVWNDLKNFITKEIGIKPGDGGYSDNFKGNPDDFAVARFFYTHLVLRFQLSQENIGNIGGLWHRLPADTRFPDHSIWQHNALVSAIQSCFELAGNKDDLGIMVFSITPVQGFIGKSRKLRDYWTSSVLLSWLAFEGIKWVMENLGPDHIIYPSLIDQALVKEYLKKEYLKNECKIEKINDIFLNNNNKIASFPNKFLFLIPFNYASEIAEEIEKHIKSKWAEINNLVLEELANKLKNNVDESGIEHIKSMFNRQNSHFWDIQWATSRILEKKDIDDINIGGGIKDLLSEKNYKAQSELLNIFLKMIKNKENYEKSGKGILYSSTHSLCQSALAVQKTIKTVERQPEPGEKCQMCGEFEVVHDKKYQNNITANQYKNDIKNFWENLSNRFGKQNIKENEKLCSICLTKRIAYMALQNQNKDSEKGHKKHILYSAFKEAENFPSTTYISLYNYFKANGIVNEQDKLEIAQQIYENEDIQTDNRDRYYAILLMDGDLMGKLVNGETIASTWESIMHPDIVEKIKNNKLEGDYNVLWQEIFNKENIQRRLVTPSIHAAISESLGDFALYGVAPIVEKKYDGRLIYAGGDDVCAVLPIDNALQAAKEIQEYYISSFRMIKKINKNDKENKEEIEGIESIELKKDEKWLPEIGKLSVNLGMGENITISAGILLCHHKENLSEMIKRAHELLDNKAKKEGGRNAVAIELRKRSGGSRYFKSKWNDERLTAFEDLISKKKVGADLSRSLAYRFEEFKDGIDAILNLKEPINKTDLLNKFVLAQLKRSGLNKMEDVQSDDDKKLLIKLSEDIRKIIVDDNNFSNEGLIIAGFLTNDDNVNKNNKNKNEVNRND